jgi:hypothetical protein
MPITIDGTGNITGLVAGGLPDGSINNADLATDAVSTSKILNGAVTTAKMGSAEQSGLAKAWVYFNGEGTVTIRASYNVSSITDVGVGDYTINLTTALADANFSAVGCAGGTSASNGDRQLSTYPTSTSTCKAISGLTGSVAKYDAQQVHVAIFR